MTALVPQSRIYEAARAVNQDLDRDGLQSLLKLPHILDTPDNPGRWLEFLHREYECDRNQHITARLWELRGDRWQDVASRHHQLTN